MALTLGMGLQIGGAGIGGEGVEPAFDVIPLDDGTAEIVNVSGNLTITISGSTSFDGTYTQDIDGTPLTEAHITANRFVWIVAPTLTGSALVGATLTGTRGLILYTGAAPTIGYQWRADAADIGGATAATFTVTETEAGTDVDLAVTAAEGADSVTEITPALSIPASTTYTDSFDTYADGEDLLGAAGYTAIGANPGPTGSHTFDYQAAQSAARMARDGNARMIYVTSPETLDADQVVEAEIAGFAGGETKVWGVVARTGGADNAGTGYQLTWSGFSNVIALSRRVAGANSNLVVWDNGGAGYTLQAGDRLRLTVEGSNLTAELRPAATGVWQTIATATDTQIASGGAGLAFLAFNASAGQFAYVSELVVSG
jgi:hypothetical protein